MNLRAKCMVFGCTNHSNEGAFMGDVCAPCHFTITTGNATNPGNSFINKLWRDLNNRLIAGIDIPLPPLMKSPIEIKYRRVTASDVEKMEKQLAGIHAALRI